MPHVFPLSDINKTLFPFIFKTTLCSADVSFEHNLILKI